MIKNFQLYGYQIAKGTKGTGWMMFTDSEVEDLLIKLKEAKTLNPDYPDKVYEILDEDAEGWFETCQWEYEVQSEIFKVLGITELQEGKIDDYVDLQTQYTIGYERYMRELIKKLYPKDYKTIFG